MNSKTDAELIADYAGTGNDAAFAEIVSRHGAMVYRICRGFVRDPHEAEDCSQAVFLVLVRKASSLGSKPNLASWLYGVTKRVSLRALERRRNRAKHEEQVAMTQQNDRELTLEEQTAIMESMYLELDALSPLQRQAVLLRHFEGHSEKQAAAIAGCSPSALGTRASDGIARLRKRLSLRGTAVSVTALLGLLSSEAQAAGPATLLPSLLVVSQSAAVSTAAGTAGTVSANAQALAEGVIKMMMWSKVKMLTAVVVAVVVLSTGTPLLVNSLAGERANGRGDSRPKITRRAAATKDTKMVDKSRFAKAMAVVRIRTTRKPDQYSLTGEVIKVLKKPRNWEDFVEVKRWKSQETKPLRLRFRGKQRAPKAGEMTVYLDSKTETWDDGSKVKTLKPYGDSVKTAISHVTPRK